MPLIERLLLKVGRRSIKRFILYAIAVVLGTLSVVDGAMQAEREIESMDSARDRALARIAAGYLRALRAQDADVSKIPASVFQEELGVADAPFLRFRVSGEHGEFIGGDAQLSAPAGGPQQDGNLQPTLFTIDGAEGPLRSAVLRGYLLVRVQSQPVSVQVAEPLTARAAARREIVFDLAVRQAARLLIVLAVIWVIIRMAFVPLTALERELARRRANDLSLVSERRPQEVSALVLALNKLLSDQQSAVDQQRRFLADASHQLRTPIAVLRTLVQGTLFHQTSHTETLPRMLSIIDRATALTNQLLSTAKTQQLIRRADWHDVQLDEVAHDISVEFAPLIARKRLDFTLDVLPITLRTDRWLLGELIKNLVSNAIHHSPKRAELGIVVRRLKGETELIVWDHGGGVDEDVKQRLFEPFNVAKGGTGIGLGLSICRQIAESMNASIDLFNRVEGGRIVGVDAVVRWSTAPEGDVQAFTSAPHA
jgi:signal transduction histidine kinase